MIKYRITTTKKGKRGFLGYIPKNKADALRVIKVLKKMKSHKNPRILTRK